MLQFIGTTDVYTGGKIDGKTLPPIHKIEPNFTDEELAVFNLERVADPVVEDPIIDPLTQPIDPVQFDAMLHLSGKYNEIMVVVDALPEPNRSVALAKINRSQLYDRDDPLFGQLGDAVGIDSDALDALWLQAQAIV